MTFKQHLFRIILKFDITLESLVGYYGDYSGTFTRAYTVREPLEPALEKKNFFLR